MKKIIFLTFIFCFLALTASKSFACSCALPSRSLEKQIAIAYEKSAAVFYGEVVEITRDPEKFYVKVKFKVEKSWKNQIESEVVIQTGEGGGDCGYPFNIGQKYLVYAYGDKNSLGTNICQRTSPFETDLKYLNKIKKPKLLKK
ncbi:MAG TPA: hypothetical protein VGC97_24005 [Pyrinomonadaceae bacterium]|jgi:hypothetical protein